MKNLFKVYLKKVFSDLHSIILGIMVAALILSVGGIWVFSKNLWILLKTTMLLPTPLWVTIIFLALFVLAYIYLKNKTSITLSTPDPEYREVFHVYWDKNNKMRCLNCGKPLKYSSSDSDPSIFNCSDPRCDSKHVLKDTFGNKISEQEAFDRMKTV
jgi:hypothetical protein